MTKVELKENFNSLWKKLHELFIEEKTLQRAWETKMSAVLSSISICHGEMLEKIGKEYQMLKRQQELQSASSNGDLKTVADYIKSDTYEDQIIKDDDEDPPETIDESQKIDGLIDIYKKQYLQEREIQHYKKNASIDDDIVKTVKKEPDMEENDDASNDGTFFFGDTVLDPEDNLDDNEEQDENHTVLPIVSGIGEVGNESKQDTICRTCGMNCVNILALLSHMKRMHPKNEYQCLHCTFSTNENHKFLFHNHVVHDRKPDNICPICEKSYSGRSEAVRHLKFVHDDQQIYKQSKKSQVDPQPPKIKTPMQCKACEYKSIKKERLDRHYRTVHEHRRDYKCTQCKFKTDSNSHLRQHVRFHHEKIFDNKCRFCYYCAICPAKLRKHIMTTHDNIRHEKCTLCPTSFSSRYNLHSHIKAVHERIKAFHCDKCLYETNKKKYLRDHENRKHNTETQ